MKSRKIMPSKDQGLTVGELTIAIGILIIAGLILSNINKDERYDQSLSIQNNEIYLNQTPSESFLNL